jgi:WD40 repeat protein
MMFENFTGNCRCSLIGHCAPVTLLKLDPLGKVLLSGDKEGRDRSIRLWNLDHGKKKWIQFMKISVKLS